MNAAIGPRCVILHGVTAPTPPPDEADTLRQVSEISDILGDLGCRVEIWPVGLDLSVLTRLAQAERPAVVVNLVEALAGAGRLVHVVPSVLEALDVPMTGCSAAAIFATSNKILAKRLLRQAGIATADWIEPGAAADPQAEWPAVEWPAVERPTVEWIVKSVWEHASIGLDAGSVVPGDRVAAQRAERQARFGGDWFAERYIDGREFNIALLATTDERAAAPQVLPIAEMTFVDFPPDAPRIVDYAAKWDETSAAFHNTMRRFEFAAEDQALLDALAGVALRCWQCFDLSGYARVDIRVDEAGVPWVLEVNANPCLSSDAGFVAAAERAGLSQRQVIARLIEPLVRNTGWQNAFEAA